MLGLLAAAGLLLAAPSVAAAPDRPSVEVEAVEASWKECGRRVFDPAWMLTPDTWTTGDRHDPDCLHLVLEPLLARRFPPPKRARSFRLLESVGDVIGRVARVRGDPERAAALLGRILDARPDIERAAGPVLRELLLDAELRDEDWDPADDEDDDGLLMGETLSRVPLRRAPWTGLDGTEEVQQVATLIFADLESIKAAENDYLAYYDHAGNTYEEIGPKRGTYLRGWDEEGMPFAALRVKFEADLPFPYSSYTCDLAILTRLDADLRLKTFVYSTSRDFYWMAGQDTFLPVRDSAGKWVAMLAIRLSGFDLRGVPDGDDERQEAVRAGLGNLKRNSERAFRAHGGEPRTVQGAVPWFDVLGPRTR